MKQLIISTILLWGLGFSSVKADDLSKEVTSLKTEIATLKTKQESLKNDISAITVKNQKAEGRISNLESKNKDLVSKIDSLQEECVKLTATQKTDRNDFRSSIDQTNEKVQSAEQILSSRTLWGVIGILILLGSIVAIVWAFLKKFKSGSTSIDSVRKAQSSLEEAQERIRKAQEKMQEESVTLDNRLLAIVQKQLDASTSTANKTGEPDHSLVVKLADEIARIETNLSKMDNSVRGYKQLVQAKDRMINNVRANGYEIISLLGQEYNDGMQFQTRFVPDENLPEGKRIITGMIKMQVNYNGKMIQPAEIVVSQNI